MFSGTRKWDISSLCVVFLSLCVFGYYCSLLSQRMVPKTNMYSRRILHLHAMSERMAYALPMTRLISFLEERAITPVVSFLLHVLAVGKIVKHPRSLIVNLAESLIVNLGVDVVKHFNTSIIFS